MSTQIQPGKKERVNFLIPHELLHRASQTAKEYHLTLSDFFRQALVKSIEELERKKRDREIEEACRFYYKADKQIAAEWEAAESKV